MWTESVVFVDSTATVAFASARSMWTESLSRLPSAESSQALPRHVPCGLNRCLFCLWHGHSALPRHVPCGLNQQKCTRRCIQIYGMCRESVDSFSLYALQYCALTIFPCSSATKAISIAINGSPGRTIDRFSWCEPHRFFCLLNLRVNEHFDIFPY